MTSVRNGGSVVVVVVVDVVDVVLVVDVVAVVLVLVVLVDSLVAGAVVGAGAPAVEAQPVSTTKAVTRVMACRTERRPTGSTVSGRRRHSTPVRYDQ